MYIKIFFLHHGSHFLQVAFDCLFILAFLFHVEGFFRCLIILDFCSWSRMKNRKLIGHSESLNALGAHWLPALLQGDWGNVFGARPSSLGVHLGLSSWDGQVTREKTTYLLPERLTSVCQSPGNEGRKQFEGVFSIEYSDHQLCPASLRPK